MDDNMTIYIRPHQLEALKVEHTKRHYYVGLDLGQSVDYTAYCVLEQVRVPLLQAGPIGKAPLQYDVSHHITYLDRLPLRTTYPQIVAHIKTLLDTAPLSGNATLVLDFTGVGRPVFDSFVAEKLKPIGISITAGDTWTRDGAVFRVSKKLLISTLDSAMNSGSIFAAPLLPNGEVLRSELADLRRKFTDSLAISRLRHVPVGTMTWL
jgi:hypothetical protein